MQGLAIIRDPRQPIANHTEKKFSGLVKLFEDGVSLLIDATRILAPEGTKIDLNTAEGASKMAAWRFLSTMPSSAVWCFDIAMSGDYLVAKNVLRLTLEEAIKLAYYVTFPDKALRQIVQDRDADETNLATMLAEMEFEHRSGLLRLYGTLSSLYAHANMSLPLELVYDVDDREQIGGGSRFLPEVFEPLVHQLLILVGNTLQYLVVRFPKLVEDQDWVNKFERLIMAADAEVPKSADV